MADLSTMTTEELQALREKKRSGGRDLTSLITGMSNDELIAARNRLLAQERIGTERAGSPTFMAADDAVRSFARGVPLIGGGMDEASAGLNTGFGYLGDYGQELEYQRERDRQYDEAHPWLSTGGQVLGAIGGTIAGARYMPLPAMPASMTGKIGASAGIGTGLGGIEGFTRGEGGMANRAANALPSAAGGAFFGMAAPPIAKGIGMAWNGIASWLANRGTDAKSINKIVTELQAAGLSPQQAAQRLQQLGPQGMIADVGPGMQQMAGATSISETGAAQLMGQRLAGRRAGGRGRVTQSLDRAFGPARDPYAVQQDTRTLQRGTGHAYQRAGEYVVATEPVADYVTQQIQRAGQNGPIGQTFQQIRNMLTDGAGNLVNRGDRVHAIREQLDDMREQAMRSGQGKLAANIGEVRRRVDAALKEGIPGFAEADRTYATAARSQEAFEQGRTAVLRGGPDTMTPEQLRALQNTSSVPENLMRQQGTRTELDRIMSNQRRDPAATIDRVTTRDWNDRKISTMIGPQRAQQLGRDLDREATFTQTSNLVEPGRGSRTAPLAATAQRLWGTGGSGGAIADMMTSGTIGGIAGGAPTAITAAGSVGISRLLRSLGNKLSQTSPEIIRRTADVLTATNGPREEFLRMIARMAAQAPRRTRTVRAIEDTARQLMIGQSGQFGYRGADAFAGRAGR